ncbi:MAG: hypothetical protein ABFD29_13365 [Anaerolineaceae bacterium]
MNGIPSNLTLNIISALVILILPGAAWTAWEGRDRRDPLEILADSVGISIAVTVLIAMVGFFLRVKFNGWIITILYSLCFLIAAAGWLKGTIKPERKRWLYFAAGILVLTGAIFWRMEQARDLVLPAWVDSVHHVLVVQKILDTGGLPLDLNPELNVPFYYHYGFHVIAALFSVFSNTEPAQAVLWFGQVINALVGLSIYRFGKTFWNDRRVAGLAALLTGFALQMPAYYVTWGRYTLLTGLIILPLAMAAAWEIAKDGPKFPTVFRLIILTAGLAISHYLALLLLGIFIAVLLLAKLFDLFKDYLHSKQNKLEASSLHLERVQKIKSLAGFGGGAILGLVVASPWLVRVWNYTRQMAGVSVNLPENGASLDSMDLSLSMLGPSANYWLMGFAGVGLLLGLLQKNKRWFAVYTLILIFLAMPWGVQIHPFRPDHFAIVLFIPAAYYLAFLITSLADLSGRKISKRLTPIIFTLASLGALGWGMWHTRSVVNPVTIFVDQADLEAIQWIQANTPEDARFYINAEYWQHDTYRGVDGGYWLLPLTRRHTIIPPGFYGFGSPDLFAQIRQWGEIDRQIVSCDDDFWNLVREDRLNYIYIHEEAGSLQEKGLSGCSRIVKEYDKNGVSIYEIYDIQE